MPGTYIAVRHVRGEEWDMNVKTVCLAILNFREATGYEIKKLSTESHYAHFVDASFGSIYPALNKMEADGLVTQREERAAGKPARKVYSITKRGREELLAQVSHEPNQDVFKSEFLLVAMCAHLLDRETVTAAIETNLRQMNAKLEMMDEIDESEKHVPTTGWLTGFARECIAAHIEALKARRAELEAIAIQPASLSEAAE